MLIFYVKSTSPPPISVQGRITSATFTPRLSSSCHINAMADLYNLSSHYWAGNVISLHAATASGDVFATVPLNFVVGNGVNTWEYILDLAEMLVEPVTDCPGSIETVDGDAVHLAAEPCAGDYVFTHRGK